MITYDTGEDIRVGDEVAEPVNGNRHGIVVQVLEPGSDEAHDYAVPEGGVRVEFQGHRGRDDPRIWSAHAVAEQSCLYLVGRDTGFVPSDVPLLYRSAQTIEKGDLVLQPLGHVDGARETRFASGEREGTVVGVLQPGSPEAAYAGHLDGGILIEWAELAGQDGDRAPSFMSPDAVVALARLFFCCRDAEAGSVPRYADPSGRIVYAGDRVEERAGSGPDAPRRGRVSFAGQAGSAEAVQWGAGSGGIGIWWDGDEAGSLHPLSDIAGAEPRVSFVGRDPPTW